MKPSTIKPITAKEAEETYTLLEKYMDEGMGKLFKILGYKVSAFTVIVALDESARTAAYPTISAIHERLPVNISDQLFALNEVLTETEMSLFEGDTTCSPVTSGQQCKPKSKKKPSSKKKLKRSAKNLKSLALRKA